MLSERAAAALNVLVGGYLQSATPVASDDTARSLDHDISPAMGSPVASAARSVSLAPAHGDVAAIGGVRRPSAFMSRMVLGILGSAGE